MRYSKVGPFNNGAAPGISKAFLDGVEDWIEYADGQHEVFDTGMEYAVTDDIGIDSPRVVTWASWDSPGWSMAFSGAQAVPTEFTTYVVRGAISGVIHKEAGAATNLAISLRVAYYSGGTPVVAEKGSRLSLVGNQLPANSRVPFSFLYEGTTVLTRSPSNLNLEAFIQAQLTSAATSGNAYQIRDVTARMGAVRKS